MQKKMRDAIKLCYSLDELDIVEKDKLPDIFGGEASLKEISGELGIIFSSFLFHIFFYSKNSASWVKKLTEMRPFFLNYSNMKINKEFYTPAVLNCEVKTLSGRLENPSAKLLTEY